MKSHVNIFLIDFYSVEISIQSIFCFDMSKTLSDVNIIKLRMKLVGIHQDFWTFCNKNLDNNHFSSTSQFPAV